MRTFVYLSSLIVFVRVCTLSPTGVDAQNNIIEIEERYSQMLDEEAHWGTKWKQLVDLLLKNEA